MSVASASVHFTLRPPAAIMNHESAESTHARAANHRQRNQRRGSESTSLELVAQLQIFK